MGCRVGATAPSDGDTIRLSSAWHGLRFLRGRMPFAYQ
jgi:hypothetical protein